MSTIISKIDSIDRLWFEPIPTKAVQVSKIVRVGDRTIVAIGNNGKIYSNGVSARVAYSCHGDKGRIADVLDGCIKLGILTSRAVKQHKGDVAEQLRKSDEKWQKRLLIEAAEKLGIDLTSEQKTVLGVTMEDLK